MKHIRSFLLLALLGVCWYAPRAQAQATVLCNSTTPCNPSTGPSNTGTGDPAWQAFGKVNANFALLPSQLFSGLALPQVNGGTGATSLIAANIPTVAGTAPVVGHCVSWLTSDSIQDAGAACGSGGGGGGSGTVNSGTSGQIAYYAAAGTVVSGASPGNNLSIVSGVLGTTQPINAQTGTTYAFVTSDAGKLVTASNVAASAYSLSRATTAGFTAGFSVDIENLGAGVVTITPTTSTINGAATLTLAQNTGCTITSDGTNYQVSACTALAGAGGVGNFTTLAVSAVSSLATGLTQAANTSVDGVTLIDATAATAGNQQYSPSIRFTGQGWKTTATAASQPVDFIVNTQTVQGAANPTGAFVVSRQINGGGYTNLLAVGSDSLGNSGLIVNYGGISIPNGGAIGGVQYISFAMYTVATLLTCNSSTVGWISVVTDQSGAPTYRGALTGGGALRVPVFCGYNGTTYAWEAH
jgi:hypothetical protein